MVFCVLCLVDHFVLVFSLDLLFVSASSDLVLVAAYADRGRTSCSTCDTQSPPPTASEYALFLLCWTDAVFHSESNIHSFTESLFRVVLNFQSVCEQFRVLASVPEVRTVPFQLLVTSRLPSHRLYLTHAVLSVYRNRLCHSACPQ